MNLLRSVLLAALLCGPAWLPAQADATARQPTPAWLAGGWSDDVDDAWSEEWWTPERGGLMLGAGRSGKGKVATGFDQMRITRDADGSLVFWGAPNGAPAVPFKATSVTDNSILFENPNHDFPNTIRYQLLPDGRLKATIAGTRGGEMSWIWDRIK